MDLKMKTPLTQLTRIKELARLIEGQSFYVPEEVRLERQMMSKHGWRYIFKHETLGELGTLMLSEKNDRLNFAIRVSGILYHPLTQEKSVVLQAVTKQMKEVLTSVLSFEENEEQDNNRPEIECEDIFCAHCGAIVALVISAYEVGSAYELAQCGEIFCERIMELNVPTWVIGDVEEIKMGAYTAIKLLALKIWPYRVKAKEMLSMTFDAKLDKLRQEHCGTT